MEAKTYKGSCHCGAVTFEATLDLESPMDCNCSLCSRAGYLLKFVAEADFTLLSGEDNLQDYQFNKKIIHHPFCKTCGVRGFGWGIHDDKKSYAVNVRCLEDVDTRSLTPKFLDGKSM